MLLEIEAQGNMRFRLRLLLLSVTVLALALGIFCDRALRQFSAVRQLLKFDFVGIEYLCGGYSHSKIYIEERNHFIHSVIAVDLDVTSDDVSFLSPILGRLPALRKINLQYQGDYEQVERQLQELQKTFPGVEIEANQYFVKIPVVG
jgi:hypothetical protein